MRLIADGNYDGRPEVYAGRPKDFLIVPLVAEKHLATFLPPVPLRIEEPTGTVTVRVSASPVTVGRVHLYERQAEAWKHLGNAKEWRLAGNEFAVAVTPGTGTDKATLAHEFVLQITDDTTTIKVRCMITPVLLTSSLDPVSEVLVIRNALSRKFANELARLVPLCDGNPKVRSLNFETVPHDLWIQDTVEIAVAATPEEDKSVRQTPVPLLGLRAKHDGIQTAPLDEFVRSHFEADSGSIPVTTGMSRPDTRWIDWYGNLEVSPPISGFPFGRILTGEQKGLGIHPELLTFLEAQRLQWPPLVLDVSWLTIGHVDELINFVPAPTAPGWRVLLPSTIMAYRILRDTVAAGKGDVPVFKGRGKKETTVKKLLDLALSEETRTIEQALKATRARIKEDLGITDAAIIDLPALFEGGLPVIPNAVNSLVVGKTVFVPAPEGPRIDGIDLFEKDIRARLEPLGLKLHFLDIFEPYHTRSGEIHCGTNAIRRFRNPAWWKTY